MSDLTFSDLVIGREYKVTLQAAQQSVSSTGTSTISITHNSTVIGLSKYDSASADNNGVQTSSVSVNFTAAATTLTFVSVASASNVIQGDGTQSETFAMLEEFTTSDGFSTNQTNRPWTAYTPTFTGFGTVSNVESYWKRQGEDMLLRINFTCGTPTTTEARVSLPGSYTSSSAIDSIELAGEGRRGAVASNQYGILIEPSVSYVTFSIQGSASNGTQKKNGDDICASGNAMIYTARVPIEGWDETMNAPLIKNSVVNSSDGVTSTEAAHINCDASSAVLSQHGSWVSSVGNVASGACAVTITTGIFSSTPYCWAIMNDSGFAATNYSLVVIPASSTSVSFDCYAGGDCTDFDVSLFCMGSK